MQQPEDKQVGFEDWALAQRTRPNEVLEKIAALVDFSGAERRLGATYSELGRPVPRAAVLLRVMLLQHLYGLSDPQAETQLGDRLSFQKFVGLHAGEAVPDETTICRFRQRMITAGLARTALGDAQRATGRCRLFGQAHYARRCHAGGVQPHAPG